MLGSGEIAGMKVAIDARTDNLKRQLRNLEGDMARSGKRIGGIFSAEINSGVGGMLAGGGLLYAIKNFATESLNTADALSKQSRVTGIAIEELQKFQFAAQQSGVATETLNKSFTFLADNMATAAKTGAGAAASAFTQLNVALKTQTGALRNISDIYKDVLTQLSQIGDEAERIRLAKDIFGKSSGVDVLQLGSGTDVQNLMNQREAMGGLWNKEDAKKAEDMLDGLSAAWTYILARVNTAVMGNMRFASQAMETIDLVDRTFDKIKGGKRSFKQELKDLEERSYAKDAQDAALPPPAQSAPGYTPAYPGSPGSGPYDPWAAGSTSRMLPPRESKNLRSHAEALAATFAKLNRVVFSQYEVQQAFTSQQAREMSDKFRMGGMLSAEDLNIYRMGRTPQGGVIVNFNGPSTFESPTAAAKTASHMAAMPPRGA